MSSALSLRWVAVSVFVLSSTLNYLDRYLLATLAPLIMTELHFNNTGYGFLISALSIAYAISSPFAGWFLDRVGVNAGISCSVGFWSLANLSTGLTSGLGGLSACRIALGIGESAGVPAFGKVNGNYLKPEERALGAAMNQIGLSVGLAITPLWIGIAKADGWRIPFVLTGLLGFVWIPVWLITSRSIPPQFERRLQRGATDLGILRDRQLLLLVIANVLWMAAYSLWSNWTTVYLVHVHHLTLQQAGHYVWIPPMISNLGGFFGGWLSLRWMKRSVPPVAARLNAIWVSAAGMLLTLLLPMASSARSGTAVISASFFFALGGSVNIYALPIDIFGAERAGLAIAALTCAFGLLQTVISPIIGYLADHHLYTEVIWLVTVPPFLSALTLMGLREVE